MMTREGGSGEGVIMTQARVCENGLDVIFAGRWGLSRDFLPHVGVKAQFHLFLLSIFLLFSFFQFCIIYALMRCIFAIGGILALRYYLPFLLYLFLFRVCDEGRYLWEWKTRNGVTRRFCLRDKLLSC